MKTVMSFWDWKEQPRWEEINKALGKISNARIYPVEMFSDDYAVIIGPKGLTKAQVEAERDAHMGPD